MDIDAILSDTSRTRDERKMDVIRRARDTVVAANLKPHHHVLELEPGKGWFTEILQRLIGPRGHLTVQQPVMLDAFFGKDVRRRLRSASYSNVTYSDAPFTDLETSDASIDRVFWLQGPHELWFEPQPGVSFGEPGAVFSEVRRTLKPDGRLVVIDNLAARGTAQSAAGNLHRSEPDALRAVIEDAGLELIHSDRSWIASDFDPLTQPTFTPSIHLRTSQFLQIYALAP